MKNLYSLRKALLLPCMLLFAQMGAQTTIIDSMKYGGITRNYRLYIPAIYKPAKAVPLIFNLHGLGSNAMQQEYYGDFRPIADTADFILCHPNGTVGSSGQGWNNFGAVGQGVDDVGFISALIDTISKKYSIDAQRVFSTGMSNGGFMTYDLACYLNRRFAAVASVTGSMIASHLSACNAQHPTPVMEIHGTADPVVSYPGNGGIVASTHIDTLVKYWVKFNHCSLTPVVTQVPNTNTTDGCTAEHQVFNGGKNGTTVELFKIIGGGHSWPGAPVNTSNGPTNHDFSASKEIWRFFSQYRLNIVTGISERKTEELSLNLYPNPAGSGFEIDFADADKADYTFHLFNSIGQEVMTQKATRAKTYISRGSLPSGLYTILVVGQGSTLSKKVLFN